ncbi:MAG: hypothetical protein LUC33_01680 [Prevotellaceae bacterium]|nr:hypothetical protein [Prevotellaceae bacterium]
MNKTYIRPTMSVEQCEAKAAFSLTFSSTTTDEGWTKKETGNSSFDTDNLWDNTEW